LLCLVIVKETACCKNPKFEHIQAPIVLLAEVSESLHGNGGRIVLFIDSVFKEIAQAKLTDHLACRKPADFPGNMSRALETLDEFVHTGNCASYDTRGSRGVLETLAEFVHIGDRCELFE
jgi:hypothetical protein